MTPVARPAARRRRAARSQFAADVRFYLSQDPRQLPSRYLYDDLGSTLFEAICRLPWYALKRAELRLLEAHAGEILSGAVSTVVELGPGSGDKLSALIAAAGPRRGRLELHLVDVSPSALEQAARTLEIFDRLTIAAHQATYERGLEAFATLPRGTGRALALFLGSNIGNFDPPGREAFLRTVRTALRPRDLLLLGADLVKPEPQLRLAYDDPLGVTAAFNRNLLVRINRELDGDFDLDAFGHEAVWNAEESRVEMHLVCRRPQQVSVPGADDLEFTMAAGDTIWTESSYKFDPAEVVFMLERCGFRLSAQWIDPVDRFAHFYAEAV